MSPHGESADSLPAPVAPALAEASGAARVPCASPRLGPEARTPLAAASPGLGDPSSPLRCPDRRGAQEPPGAPPASPPRETAGGSSEEPPVPVLQVSGWEESGRRRLGGGSGLELGALPQCLPFQEQAGVAVLDAPGDGKASEPALGDCVPGPATSCVAKEDAEQTAGEAHLAPGATQEALAQRLSGAQACRGGDAGAGLRPRAEVQGWGRPGLPRGVGGPLPASASPELVAHSARSPPCSRSALRCVSGCFRLSLCLPGFFPCPA